MGNHDSVKQKQRYQSKQETTTVDFTNEPGRVSAAPQDFLIGREQKGEPAEVLKNRQESIDRQGHCGNHPGLLLQAFRGDFTHQQKQGQEKGELQPRRVGNFRVGPDQPLNACIKKCEPQQKLPAPGLKANPEPSGNEKKKKPVAPMKMEQKMVLGCRNLSSP